jgi:DNA-binding MarR family transcriptional regulator
MNALAETLACDASNVTGVVDKLEARGLIARQAAESDRRVKVLLVTDKGRELRQRLIANAATPPAGVVALPKDVRDKMTVGLRSLLSARDGAAALGAAG